MDPLDDFRQAARCYIGCNQGSAATVYVLYEDRMYHNRIAGIYASKVVNPTVDLVDPSLADGICFS